MSQIRAAASQVLDARPELIYAILSDYRSGHPHILPGEHFKNLVVESGGQGAGTTFRFVLRAGGTERPYRRTVSEPQPGRVLLERDTASTLATSFTITPEGDGRQARVEIATVWDAAPGWRGIMERLLYPAGMRRIYAKELVRLAAYAREQSAVSGHWAGAPESG